MTNGDSAARRLRKIDLIQRILPWRDALHDGPVPDVPEPDLRRIRAAFLVDDPAGRRECLRWLEHRDQSLLEADPPNTPIDARTRLRVTPAGHRVLRGEADHVAQSGIDRWIGGVHLAGDTIRWRWDEGTESLVG